MKKSVKFLLTLAAFGILLFSLYHPDSISNLSWIQRDGEYEELLVIKPVPSHVQKESLSLVFSRFDEADKFSSKEIMLFETVGQKAFDALSNIQLTYESADKRVFDHNSQTGLKTFMTVGYNGKWGISKFVEIKNSQYVRFFPDMNGSSYRILDRKKLPPWLNLLICN